MNMNYSNQSVIMDKGGQTFLLKPIDQPRLSERDEFGDQVLRNLLKVNYNAKS